MGQYVRTRLSVMMFLQFFIWGAWYLLVFGYLDRGLGFSALEQWVITGAFNIAAIVALFFSAQFADRNFAAEKFVAFSQLVGGLAMLGLYWIKSGWSATFLGLEINLSFWAFFALMLVHCLFYVPTISITNSIAFANLKDPQREFGQVRLWGTIGWIVASWPWVFILIDWAKVPAFADVSLSEWLRQALDPANAMTGSAYRQTTRFAFVLAGAASLVLAAFSIVLPHTPPKRAGAAEEKLAWLEAMKLLAVPFVFVLFFVTFLDSTVHQLYFFWTERYLTAAADHYGVGIASNWVFIVMSLGQVAEIGTLALLALVLKRLGWRYTMVIGILGHAVRFTVFALAPYPVPAILAILLHGICYAFFFATVYMFVDEFFPKDARSSAQGLFNVLILGVGPLLGNFLGPYLGLFYEVGKYQDPEGKEQPIVDFSRLFLVPAAMAVVAALILLLFFRPPAGKKKEAEDVVPTQVE
jgi:nucleoside transporter